MPRTDHVFWLATGPSDARPPFRGEGGADVVVVGAGFTGLWTAIRLLEMEPSLRVVILEQAVVGFGASGRNGGFCEASLTHGLANGLHHFPDEIDVLQREGAANLADLVGFVRARGIDCDLEQTGSMSVAVEPWQARELEAAVEVAARHGEAPMFLDRDAVQAAVHSPRYLAGLRRPASQCVMVDPAKLVRGHARVARELGATIHETTRVTRIDRHPDGAVVRTVAEDGGGAVGASTRPLQAGPAADGTIVAGHVVVATSAYSTWYRPIARVQLPVYDYVLVSDPLTPAQRMAVGWDGREGLSDSANRFHYFRLTADDRILWGGWDAVYHYGSRVDPSLDARPATFATLEANFRWMFPGLADLRFPFRWGGAIDTTTRFHVVFGQELGGRVTYAIGYTGLGVGASRWAAGVVRDFVLRPDSELLRLRFVRRGPLGWPPEPFRSIGVRVVQRAIADADEHEGRRGLVLRALDRLGIGFDS
jgi:glycine/D-amino acid oxidase-like deaminating enzyme